MGCIDTDEYDDDISSSSPGYWTARTVSPEEAEQLMKNVDVNDDTIAFADKPLAGTAHAMALVDRPACTANGYLSDDVEEDKPNTKKTRKKK